MAGSSKGAGKGRGTSSTLPAGIADATTALRRRRQRRQHRLWLRVGITACAVALVVAATWVVGFSSLLALRTVHVEGSTLASDAQVRQRAAAPIGTPLARVSTSEITERVATMPQVAGVDVSRSWPHGVVITITERTPVVQISSEQGWGWVDQHGVLFHHTNSPHQRLPRAQAPNDARLRKDVAGVAAVLTPQLRKELNQIVVRSPDDITLQLKDKRQVIWGSVRESKTKAQVATALLGVKASVYDVSSPANPTSR